MSQQVLLRTINESSKSINSIPSPHQEVRTTLISKNSLLSIGIKQLLEGTNFAVSGIVSNAATLAEHYSSNPPDLFIVDGSPAVEHTVEAVNCLKAKFPEVRVAVIAEDYDLSFVRLGLGAGVDGFCLSGSRREVLIKSLELVMLGEAVLPTALMATLLTGPGTSSASQSQGSQAEVELSSCDPRARKLSAREAEILNHLMDGAPNKVIARKLDVAEATIKVHIKAILRKIGAANRTQAAMWASTHLPASNGSALAA